MGKTLSGGFDAGESRDELDDGCFVDGCPGSPVFPVTPSGDCDVDKGWGGFDDFVVADEDVWSGAALAVTLSCDLVVGELGQVNSNGDFFGGGGGGEGVGA